MTADRKSTVAGAAASQSGSGMPLTEDMFLGDRLCISQPERGYRAGIDAVLLAASVPAADGGSRSLLDIGAGVGTVGLCAAARLADLNVMLLECQAPLVTIARRNIAANGLDHRMRAVFADVTSTSAELARLGLAPETFDHCLANPPFHDELAGTQSANDLKAAAHAMPADSLDDWVRFMARMVRPGGRAAMVHKAEALPRVLAAFEPRFGNIVVFPIFARAGGDAIRVIVEGGKGSRAPLSVRQGLILHGEGQGFTAEAEAILRHGAGLALK